MSPTVLPAPKLPGAESPGVGPQPGLRGHHVLAGFIVFFGTIFAVNGVLLYKALSTHSGIVAQEPYRKGLHYNERVDADERQRALGWREDIALDAKGQVGVTLTNSTGGAVTDLSITGYLGRPSTTKHDLEVKLKEIRPGQYSADVGALETGAWLLALEARPTLDGRAAATSEPIYRLKRRLWLKP
jgi:nitrogen fixation protein FixH